MNKPLTFHIGDAHENDTLNKVQAGDYVILVAMVKTIETMTVEVTGLGREDPQVIKGEKTVTLVMTSASRTNAPA